MRYLLLWIVAATLMVAMTLMTLSAAHVDGAYVPSNADAFYHARRILDAVMTGQPVIQFDTHMHAPEGSWVSWPWAYDAAMAQIVRLFGPFATEAEANDILMNIPVAAGVVGVGLVLLLGHSLRLPFAYLALLLLGFVALPSVHTTFAVGNIDHHYAESLWTTLALCAGIWFLRNPRRFPPALCLGAVLGSANGVHTSLFILQVPVVCCFLLQWLRGAPLPPWRVSAAFGAALLAVTLAICLHSMPLRQGSFEFYLLSWFHVYVAAGTALVCLATSSIARRPRAIVLLAAAGVAAAWPLLGSVDLGARFVGGGLAGIQNIQEIHSPYYFMFNGNLLAPYLLYLLWLGVPATLYAAYLAWCHADAGIRCFGVAAAMGLVLMQFQARLHVFGEVALVAVPLFAAHAAALRWPDLSGRIALGTGVAFALAISPVTRMLRTNWLLAGYAGYAEMREVFPVLKEACARHPGVVLAPIDAGHWVRYHSGCSVIGNVFLVTPQQAAKARETRRLLHLTPAQLLAGHTQVRYVLAFHSVSLVPGAREPDLEALRRRMVPMERALLGPPAGLPPEFHLLRAVRTRGGQTYGCLFEIVRAE